MFRRASVDIECVYNYAEACKREAEIVPIRGTDIKPIGPRRHKQMQILKNADCSIACRLYNTDVVTYHADGRIVIQVGGWASIATSEFATNVLGTPLWQFDNQLWIKAKAAGDTDGYIKSFPLLSHGDNVVRRDPHGDLVLDNPQPCKVHKISRAGANNVRTRYKSFRDYIDRMARLRGVSSVNVSQEEMQEMFTKNGVYEVPPMLKVETNYILPKARLAEFQQLIEDHGVVDKTQDFYRAFLWMAHGLPSYRRWNVVNRDMLLKALDELTFYMHRGEAFEETQLVGSVKRDPYAKFFD